MPSTYTSPYATSFNSACKRGTSYNVAVCNIAKRNNTTPARVWASLCKANLCYRQKFNGTWIYFPCNVKKFNATSKKECQFNTWQCFAEWCIGNGVCTPEQMHKHCGSQKEFMTWCRKFWGKQYTSFNTTTKKSTHRKSTGSKSYSFAKASGRKTIRRAA